MAVEGVGNLVQNLADHLFGQGPAVQAGTRIVGVREVGNGTVAEDTFTPSAQNSSTQATAQAAGIFQLSPGTLTAVTADVLPAQPAPNATQTAAPGQAGSGAAPNAVAAQAAAAAATSQASNSGQTASSPAVSVELQNKIHQLNASLPALGLTNNEIQEIDRIASLIKDFNPAAYTDLVNQFEALAQNAAQQNAAGALQASAPGSATTTSTGSNANNGSFQVQQILIKFADSQGAPSGQLGNGGQSSPVNPNPSNAAGLQVEQVQF